MTVTRPVTELFWQRVTQEEMDAWLDENLQTATFEELAEENIYKDTLLLHLKTKKQTRRVLNAMAEKKDGDLTLEEVNPKDKFGIIALHRAKTEGQTQALLEAMENAAKARGKPLTLEEVNPKNEDGKTALHYAKTEGQTRAILQAMENAAGRPLTLEEVNPKDWNGTTALRYAKTKGQTRLILEAMENAAKALERPLTLEEVNPKDNYGFTALHMAKTEGQTRLILEAMEKAAGRPLTLEEVNSKDCGHTALHYAKTEGQKLLLNCAMRLAEINAQHDPALEQDYEAQALNSLKENGYNFNEVSTEHLKFIQETFPEYSNHLDKAILLNRKASGIKSLQKAILTRAAQGKLLSEEIPSFHLQGVGHHVDKIEKTATKYGLEMPEGVEISKNAPAFYNVAEAILEKTKGLSITPLDLTNSLIEVFGGDLGAMVKKFDIKDINAKPDSRAMASNAGLTKLSKTLRNEKPTAETLTELVEKHVSEGKDKGMQL